MDQIFRPRLVSVGYEGRDASELIRFLRNSEVDVLVDIRLNPISRKPGLSKARLTENLNDNGIQYIHYRELGNPKDNRDGFRAGHQSAFDRYRSILAQDDAKKALGHVSELLDHEVVALLCFEHDDSFCHRRLVADALVGKKPQLAVDRV